MANPKAALRKRIIKECKVNALKALATSFRLDEIPGTPVKAYFGCENIVYPCLRDGRRHFLRLSYREDRDQATQQSELDFVAYLKSEGARVAAPIPAASGRLLETMEIAGREVRVSLFEEATGDFFYERGWELPSGAQASEYFFNQGALLGRVHALSSSYAPATPPERFDWIARHSSSVSGDTEIAGLLPSDGNSRDPRRDGLRAAIVGALNEIDELGKKKHTYGLCHNDFNEGNFTIDYGHPPACDLTLFDFEDMGYNYFMYDFACLWEANTGFAFAEDTIDGRKKRMDFLLAHATRGYRSEFKLDDATLATLPRFLRACHVENLLQRFREMLTQGMRVRYDAEIRYHATCLTRGIEWLGLYDKLFNPENPFELE